ARGSHCRCRRADRLDRNAPRSIGCAPAAWRSGACHCSRLSVGCGERALRHRARERGHGSRMTGTPNQPRVCFIVESGTDVRLVEGLAERGALQVLARDIPGGRPVSQPTAHPISIASSGRLTFACQAFATILRSSIDVVLVQGHGVAALAANVAARIRGIPCWMLICSPAAEYYEARRGGGSRFSPATPAGAPPPRGFNRR